jgi:hypothetical protein
MNFKKMIVNQKNGLSDCFLRVFSGHVNVIRIDKG